MLKVTSELLNEVGLRAMTTDESLAITDTPPPEILATGHTRCVIALKEENIAEWLRPDQTPRARLEEILSDRQAPYYEHRIAA